MANYFTQFSFEFPTDSAEEVAWFERLGEHIEGVNTETGSAHVEEFAALGDADPAMADFINFDLELGDGDVAIYTAESGTPEHVAVVLQMFLAKFRPDECIGFEWANTCSRPRVDSFGGGAVMVTASGSRWFLPGQMLTAAMADFESAKEKAE